METTLVIFVLSIQSSYLNNSEIPAANGNADTVRFFVGPNSAWRIKTFAVDEDVHVYSLGSSKQDTVVVVSASTERSYGDVIANRYVVSLANGVAGLQIELKHLGLNETMEVSENGYAFAVPQGTHYRTKSRPEP